MTEDGKKGNEKEEKKGEETEFVIGPHSPYSLHPSDASGVTITTIKFNGKNYNLWEKAIRMALKADNKLGFINGTVTKAIEITSGRW